MRILYSLDASAELNALNKKKILKVEKRKIGNKIENAEKIENILNLKVKPIKRSQGDGNYFARR